MPGHSADATPGPPVQSIWTIGHSTREWEMFVGMLGETGIEVLADVRYLPL